MLLAMLLLGESLCDFLEADFEKCDDRFPPYVDLEDALLLSFSSVFLSGVKGDELLTGNVVVRLRGEGVRGIRPPATRVLNSPVWDLMGDTKVAILYRGYDLGRRTNKCIDR